MQQISGEMAIIKSNSKSGRLGHFVILQERDRLPEKNTKSKRPFF